MASHERLVWRGPELTARVKKAARAGLIDIAAEAATIAKTLAPEDHNPPDEKSGTLKRSVTIGAAGHDHGSDYRRAEAGEDLLVGDLAEQRFRISATRGGETTFRIEIGSWIPYACVEEVRHPFIHPAIELVRADADALMIAAFRKTDFLLGAGDIFYE